MRIANRILLGAVTLLLAAPGGAPATPLSHDVNGDGLADVAGSDSIGGAGFGGATVIFGARDRGAPPSLLAPGTRGFRITTDSATTGEVIGDVNGDGLADVLVDDSNGAWVVYGKRDAAPVLLSGAAFKGGQAGVFLEVEYARGAGDVNGDGLADIVFNDENGRNLAAVRLGSRTAPLRKGFRIRSGGRVQKEGGITPDIVPAGDTNGDGRDDLALVVQDPNGRADGFDVEEMVFVIWGKRDHRRVTVAQGRLSSSARVRSGRRPAGHALFHRRRDCWCQTFEVGPAGDLNGDGRGELGVTWMDPFKDGRSRVDVLFGRRESTPVTLPGPGGAVIARASWVTPFGGAVGDLTGDGRDDMLVAHNGSHQASLRLLSGRLVRRRVRAKTLALVISGGPHPPDLVQPAGDLDGDGHDDVLLGFEIDGAPATTAGIEYAIVYGAAPLAPVDLAHPGSAATVIR